MSIVDDILRREGHGFTNDPRDRGGATKYGITQPAWDDYVAKHPARVGPRSVATLTEAMAREFYQVMHVGPWSVLRDPALHALMADCSVNHGVQRATRWLQSAVEAREDGKLGPETIRLANASAGAYASVLCLRLKFYATIAADQQNDPDAKFLRGWINRACEFVR